MAELWRFLSHEYCCCCSSSIIIYLYWLVLLSQGFKLNFKEPPSDVLLWFLLVKASVELRILSIKNVQVQTLVSTFHWAEVTPAFNKNNSEQQCSVQMLVYSFLFLLELSWCPEITLFMLWSFTTLLTLSRGRLVWDCENGGSVCVCGRMLWLRSFYYCDRYIYSASVIHRCKQRTNRDHLAWFFLWFSWLFSDHFHFISFSLLGLMMSLS